MQAFHPFAPSDRPIKNVTVSDMVPLPKMPVTPSEAPGFVDATDLEAQFQAEGFRFGQPPWINPHSAKVDRVVCVRSRCPVCGHCGRIARPYHKPAGMRYKVLAVCRSCNHGEEV